MSVGFTSGKAAYHPSSFRTTPFTRYWAGLWGLERSRCRVVSSFTFERQDCAKAR